MIGANMTHRERRRLDAVQASARIHLAAKSSDLGEILADALQLDEFTGGATDGRVASMKRRGEAVAIAGRISIAGKRPTADAVIEAAAAIEAFVTGRDQ